MAEAVANPRLISLAAGLVDYDALPVDETAELLRDLLADTDRAQTALQYGTTEGFIELRQTLFQHLAAQDGVDPEAMPGSPESLLVTTGSQQLLHLLADLLIDPGDIVITAWPSYFVFTGALTAFGAEVRGVDLDEHGVIPEQLDALLAALQREGRLDRVKVVYLVTYHQNPTGLTLAAERKPAVMDIVKRYSIRHRILVIEDAAYRELTYEGEPPPSLLRHDPEHQHVALLQTFSKPFSPGLKTGYGLLPRELVDAAVMLKGGRDFGSNNLSQHLLLRAMQTGVFARHVERLRRTYARKRDVMLDALETHMPDGVTWTRPGGGLYVWLRLPESIDTSRGGPLFQRKLSLGVLGVPGAYCYPNDPTRTPPTHEMRLSFGVPGEADIREGVRRLAEAVKTHV